jgi:hypothetical protein
MTMLMKNGKGWRWGLFMRDLGEARNEKVMSGGCLVLGVWCLVFGVGCWVCGVGEVHGWSGRQKTPQELLHPLMMVMMLSRG